MANIIVKKYEHYNRSMGCYIGSKREYNEQMARRGFVSDEKADSIADSAMARDRKEYGPLSEKARAVLDAVKCSADKDGKLHLSSRTIDGLKECGVDMTRRAPEGASADKGGFV